MRDKALSKKCIHERQHTRRWDKILFFIKDFPSVSSAPGFEVLGCSFTDGTARLFHLGLESRAE